MRIRLEGKQLHNALHLRTKRRTVCNHQNILPCTVGQHFENVGLSTSRFAENSVFGANSLKNIRTSPPETFLFFAMLFCGEKAWYTESDNSEFKEVFLCHK